MKRPSTTQTSAKPTSAKPTSTRRTRVPSWAWLPVLVAGLVALAGPANAQPASGSAAGTAGLSPGLAAAYSAAEFDARTNGVPLSITSGYRTPEMQEQLWQQGLATYGSPEATRPWVLPPDQSTHVSGQAIDVGPQAGAAWLEANGSRYGLCRTYANEWWHFELATAPGGACPAMLPDASWR